MSLDFSLYATDVDGNEIYVFGQNVTHNLVKMAGAAGLYKAMWRPEEMDPPATKAGELVDALQAGVAELATNPSKYRPLSPNNGWGTYKGLLSASQAILEACRTYPSAAIHISR